MPLVSQLKAAILDCTESYDSRMKNERKKSMKILKIGGVLFLAAATVFFGSCFFFGQKPSGGAGDGTSNTDAAMEELAYYRGRAEQLENELSALKQEQYASQKQYEDRITELELLLQTDAAPTPPPTSVTYTYTVSQNEITITGYQGTETKLIIPETIDGLRVVAIGREAFRESALVEVVIPSTVKTIDWFAFYGCASLKSITIPTSVTKIEYGVFDGCPRLTVSCEANSYAYKYARSYGMTVETA